MGFGARWLHPCRASFLPHQYAKGKNKKLHCAIFFAHLLRECVTHYTFPLQNERYRVRFSVECSMSRGAPLTPKKRKKMYAIIRTSKLKTSSDIGASEQHCKRMTYDAPNADAMLSHHNFEFEPKKTFTEPFKAETLNGRIKEYLDENNVKIRRKDAVKCVEVVMTASPEFFEDKKSRQTVARWAKHNEEFLSDFFSRSGGKLVSFIVHMDEKTPHIHAHVVPTVDDLATGGLKLNCREYLGGPEKMRKMQDEYAQVMQRFYPELERGQEKKKTRANHRTLKSFYAGTEKLVKAGLNPADVDKYIREVKEKVKVMPREQKRDQGRGI
jgi:diadenosine tetraphosphate (Ap4A) HIT family hydrolase